MKNTKSEMKNTLDGINPVLNITEESISKPKDIAKKLSKLQHKGENEKN